MKVWARQCTYYVCATFKFVVLHWQWGEFRDAQHLYYPELGQVMCFAAEVCPTLAYFCG